MKARAYPVPGADLMQVATLIHADLSRDGFEVRIVPLPPPHSGLVVEVHRPHGLLQRSTGHGAVLKAWLTPTPVGFSVQVGTDRLGDAARGAIEWLLATPALVTEGYAAFQQAQVDDRILRVVDHWVTSVAAVRIDRRPANMPEVGPCSTCRTPLPYGARFCPRCGHDTHDRAAGVAACPSCKGAVALDAVFCPHCGTKVARDAQREPCVACRTPLDDGATFCSECGARQDTADS